MQSLAPTRCSVVSMVILIVTEELVSTDHVFWGISLEVSQALPLLVFIQKEWRLEQGCWRPSTASQPDYQMVVLDSAMARTEAQLKLVQADLVWILSGLVLCEVTEANK